MNNERLLAWQARNEIDALRLTILRGDLLEGRAEAEAPNPKLQ
jgi:hypothetical protein